MKNVWRTHSHTHSFILCKLDFGKKMEDILHFGEHEHEQKSKLHVNLLILILM